MIYEVLDEYQTSCSGTASGEPGLVFQPKDYELLLDEGSVP
jgi:hypothetical protein